MKRTQRYFCDNWFASMYDASSRGEQRRQTGEQDNHSSWGGRFVDNQVIASNAAKWALSKVGCEYSQEKRLQEDIFDCSSLVARSYAVQGKRWKYGGSVPRSNEEVYDDEFELLWPKSYTEIGKKFGGIQEIHLARQQGDLQFLCTDANTSRSNRITHVAMVADIDHIVHARGKAYGVCTNVLTHYSGKVCAVTRYNPNCALKKGMKGYRTLALQKALNAWGTELSEDGEYGKATESGVRAWQVMHGLAATGEADPPVLKLLGLEKTQEADLLENSDEHGKRIRVTGNTVNIRTGPGTEYPSVAIAREGDLYKWVDAGQWRLILVGEKLCWISSKYVIEI